MSDFDDEEFNDATGFDSDVGSEAELERNTWDDACAWESWNACGDFPPDSAMAPPAVLVKDVVCYRDDCEFPMGVCYTGLNDCLCLISLIRNMRYLYYGGDGALERTEHNEADGCAPDGKVGYLLRCLCSPLVMNGITQYLTEIRGPGCSMMLSKTMYAAVQWRGCNRVSPPAGRISLALIGHLASVVGSVSHTDCTLVNGAIDKSPG